MSSSSPLRRPTYWILAALAEQPRHGYGILQRAAEMSNGEVRLAAGTLYGALDRLAADALIELDREEAHDGRTRRYYRITRNGRDVLGGEVRRLAADAATGRRAMRLRRNEALPGGSA